MPYVFDAYGTLFDFHAAVSRHHKAAGPDAALFLGGLAAKADRVHLDPYAGRPLCGVLDADAARARLLLRAIPSVDRKLRGDLLSAYLKLDAYPDARTLLEALKARGERTAILTNGSPAMVASAVEAAGLKSVLDAVLSVDTVKMFKPRPEVYALVTKEFSCKPSDVVFVSSNRWDAFGATASVPHGLDQPRQGAGRIPGIPAGRGRIRPDRRAVGPLTGTISGIALAGAGRDCQSSHQKPHFEQPPSVSRRREGRTARSAA